MKMKTLRLFLGLTLIAASAPAQQFNGVDLPTGKTPLALATADLNGDGILDLVTANADGKSVSVLLGLGSGSFAMRRDFLVPAAPQSVIVADFNGDAKADVAVTSSLDNAVFLFLGGGDGTLASPTRFPTGTAPSHAAASDLNADGHIDFITANNVANTVSVFLGRGDGTFASRNDFQTSTAPVSISVSDHNRDGKPDLVTANFVGQNVSVLLGNGDGSFQPAQHFPVGVDPSAVVATDANQDSKVDVITVNSGQSSVSVLPGRGDGTFDPRTDLGTDTEPIAVTAVDFNNDGIVDLLTGNLGLSYYYYYYGFGSSFSLLLGNGNGTFRAKKDFYSPSGHNTLTGMIAADLNGDGWPDFAATDADASVVTVYFQGSSLVFDPTRLAFSRTQSVAGASVPQIITVTNRGAGPLAVLSLTLTGQDSGDFTKSADNCSGVSLAIDASCSLSIAFSPASFGRKVASLSITANMAGSPALVALEGGGGDFSIAAAQGSATLATVAPGGTATYSLTLAAAAGFNAPVSLSCFVSYPFIPCSVTPVNASFDSSGNASATLTLTTVAPANAQLSPLRFPPARLDPWGLPAALLVMAAVGLLLARNGSARPRMRFAPATITLVFVLLASACGGGPPPPRTLDPRATPPGIYTVTVRATAQGLTHSITLSLTVR